MCAICGQSLLPPTALAQSFSSTRNLCYHESSEFVAVIIHCHWISVVDLLHVNREKQTARHECRRIVSSNILGPVLLRAAGSWPIEPVCWLLASRIRPEILVACAEAVGESLGSKKGLPALQVELSRACGLSPRGTAHETLLKSCAVLCCLVLSCAVLCCLLLLPLMYIDGHWPRKSLCAWNQPLMQPFANFPPISIFEKLGHVGYCTRWLGMWHMATVPKFRWLLSCLAAEMFGRQPWQLW